MEKKPFTGFTIIELVVVIAIISILASIVLISVKNYQKKAEETSALATINQLALAVQIYRSEHGQWPGDCNQYMCQLGSSPPIYNGGLNGFVPEYYPKNNAHFVCPTCEYYIQISDTNYNSTLDCGLIFIHNWPGFSKQMLKYFICEEPDSCYGNCEYFFSDFTN